MSEITIAVDIPRRTFSVQRANRFNLVKDEVKAKQKIDLNDYDLETAGQTITYPIRSQQDYESVLGKGRVALQARLKDYVKPRCLACDKQFGSKGAFEEHFKECGSVQTVGQKAPTAEYAGREAASSKRGALALLVHSSNSAIYSLLSAM